MNNHFVHESSYVDDAKIGEGTKIWHFSHIQNGAIIGENCIIGQNVNVAPGVIIGNNVKIQNNVSLYKGVVIEDDVFIGPSAVFTNVINPRAFIERKNEFNTTIVCRGATIGANATIICGNKIGKYSMVGAGSVVTKNVEKRTLVYGVPAEFHGFICNCGVKLTSTWHLPEIICSVCGKKYTSSLEEIT